MINFGKYDQKVEFITFSPVTDGAGGTIISPATSLSTFASVNQTNGGDGTLGKKMEHSEESKFKISLNNGMHQEEIKQKHKKSLNRPETKEKQRSAKLGVPRKRILCKKCNNEISDNNYTRHINIYCKKA